MRVSTSHRADWHEPSTTNNCYPSRAPKNFPESRDSTSMWTESEKHRISAVKNPPAMNIIDLQLGSRAQAPTQSLHPNRQLDHERELDKHSASPRNSTPECRHRLVHPECRHQQVENPEVVRRRGERHNACPTKTKRLSKLS